MSSCIIPTLTINNTDAVGDSAGKHNYNALVLDTNICNLSSKLFTGLNDIESVFQAITGYINAFTEVAPRYDDKRVYQMAQVSTSVRLLSSFWGKQEFSIQYPINGSILNPTDTINAPSLSSVDLVSINKSVNTRLKPLANLYLNANFPPTSYVDGSIININFFLYNISPNPSNPNHLITSKFTPNIFSYNVRDMDVSFYRDNVYLKQGINLKYYKQDNIWNYIGYNAEKYSESLPLSAPQKTPVTIKPASQIQIPTKILKTKVYTTNSTLTTPSDVTNALLLLVGGGGGGGGGLGSNGGGGGGGGSVTLQVYDVNPNQTYSIIIGNGGNGGTSGATGSNGTSTYFDTLSSVGGYGGIGGNSGLLGYSSGGQNGGGGIFGYGGQGITLTQNASSGQIGFAYNDVLNYPSGTYFSGGGGGGCDSNSQPTGGGGGGGFGGNGTTVRGSDATSNTGGGGGGGGISGGAGGKGGSGFVIVSYYTAT